MRKKIAAFILITLFVVSSCTDSFASQYNLGPGQKNLPENIMMKNVNLSMMQSSYWTSYPGSEKLLMSPEKIEEENEANLHNSKCCMNDLSQLSETYKGTELRAKLAKLEDQGKLYLNGEMVLPSYFDKLKKNIAKAPAKEVMTTGYGFCINRSELKSIPSEDWLSDDPADPEWDNTVLTAVLPGEALTAYLTTADGKFTYVRTICCDGWMPTKDIVLCHSKEEWENARHPEEFIVVTAPEIITEMSYNKAHSQIVLEMGTVLELCEEPLQMVDNRMSWCNYVVYYPGRGSDGLYEKQKMLVPFGSDVSFGYLRFTQKNILDLAFKSVGKRYGWGGSMNAQDCSSFVREVYRCFGFELPRNTTWQGNMKATITGLKDLNQRQKTAALDMAAPGSILQFPGHEMLYLGKSNGKHYVINDVSSLAEDTGSGLMKLRVRTVIINSLEDTKRANGKTWYDELTQIITLP